MASDKVLGHSTRFLKAQDVLGFYLIYLELLYESKRSSLKLNTPA
jgi:hypothetical protein